MRQESYEVYEDGPLVILRVGNSELPMTWDVAMLAAPMIRVALRNAFEFVGKLRVLPNPTDDVGLIRAPIRRSEIQIGRPKIYAVDADVIWEVGNANLTLSMEPARNIAHWLHASGEKVNAQYFPDIRYNPYAANLKDGNAEDMKKMKRRDATATFG